MGGCNKPPFFLKNMIERKTATTIDMQIAKLRERGMVIANPNHVKEILLSVGYYRMGFYWYPFEISKLRKRGIHKFRRDTTWEKAEALYDFDSRFRNLLSYYLQIIETDIRTYLTYKASNYYKEDPFWFVNNSYVKSDFISRFIGSPDVRGIYGNLRLNNDVIKKHHRKHPEDIFAPAWKTLEFLMFGDIQYLYNSILDKSLREKIYQRYDVDEEDDFVSYIDILRATRNVCAHSRVLYDKNLHHGIRGSQVKLGLNTGEEMSIVGILKLVYYMLRQIDPEKEVEMRNALRNLVNQVEYDIVRFAISRLAF